MIFTVLPILALIVILLIFSGFFSGSEIAFAKCNKQRLRKLADCGNRKAALAQKINDDFTRTLSAILAGNELVNIAASSAVTVLAITVSPENQVRAQTVASAALTVALLIFGEIVPKILFSRMADSMVLTAAGPISLLTRLFMPLVASVDALVKLLSPLWTPDNRNTPSYTSDELSVLIDDFEKEGHIDPESAEFSRRTIRFYGRELRVRDIMTSRVDIVAFCLDDGMEALTENGDVLLNTYSYIPVYKESLDDIIGVLPTREYMKELVRGGKAAADAGTLVNMLKKPIQVYEGIPAAKLFGIMKSQSSEFAVVLDEFGGVTGIVTMEDIYEQILGEIYDERDDARHGNIIQYTENEDSAVCIVRGELSLTDLFELVRDRYNYRLHDVESTQTTVGGWTNELLGHIAVRGETAEEDGIKITVLSAAENRIETLRIEFEYDKQI